MYRSVIVVPRCKLHFLILPFVLALASFSGIMTGASDELPSVVLFSPTSGGNPGVVVRVDRVAGEWSVKQLASDVRGVDVSRSGRFAYCTMGDRWFSGDAFDDASTHTEVTKYMPRTPQGKLPPGCLLSHQGDKVAAGYFEHGWRKGSPGFTTLRVVSLDPENPLDFTLRKEASLEAIGWSPDDEMLAYYLGSKRGRSPTGYRLVSLNPGNLVTAENVLTPISVKVSTIGMTFRPLWSPDGQHIIYMGRYNESEAATSVGTVPNPLSLLWVSTGKIVSLPGRGAFWSSNSRFLHTVSTQRARDGQGGVSITRILNRIDVDDDASVTVLAELAARTYGHVLAPLSDDGRKWLCSKGIGEQPCRTSQIFLLDTENMTTEPVMVWRQAWGNLTPDCRVIYRILQREHE